MNQIKHNPHLDGLRGIAILLVMGFHYFTGFYVLDFGWSGVDLFFVLSGYLLSGRLYPHLNDKKLLWKFYFNRILRIVPLYFLFLSIFFICWFAFASQKTIDSYSIYKNNILGFFGFASNWIFIKNISQSFNHLNHLWSLAVEEQFYIIFPILVISLKSKKKLLLAGILILMVVLITRCIYYHYLPNKEEYLKLYWNSFFRVDSFLYGFVLYMLIKNGFTLVMKKYFVVLFSLTISLLSLGILFGGTMRLNSFFVTIGFTLIGIFYAFFIFLVEIEENNFLKKITALHFLRQLGKISYGLYVFHWPIYLFGFSLINLLVNKLNFNLNPVTIQLINALFSFTITYFLSKISFQHFESFFLKWKFKLSP